MVNSREGIQQDNNVAVKVIWRALVDVLKQGDLETPVLDARLLIQHAMGMTHEELLMYGNRGVSKDQLQNIEKLIERRLNHEPVSRITGMRGFWKSDFIVTPATLDPRADSETLIEAVLQNVDAPPETILDCGTGTGCLVLSLLQEYKEAKGIGLDIGKETIAVSKQNADRLELSDRITFIATDWNDYRPDTLVDIFISNPPYITTAEMESLAPNVKNYDPHHALWAGEDGLMFYRQLTALIPVFVKPKGWIFFEIGHTQAHSVKEILVDAGITVIETRQDLNSRDRVIVARNL